MSNKYINTEQIEQYLHREEHGTPDERWRPESEFARIIDCVPAADVVEVEPLRKRIKADLEEARKLHDEHSSELIRAFQQGRIFAHKFDLLQIERTEEKQNDINEYIENRT